MTPPRGPTTPLFTQYRRVSREANPRGRSRQPSGVPGPRRLLGVRSDNHRAWAGAGYERVVSGRVPTDTTRGRFSSGRGWTSPSRGGFPSIRAHPRTSSSVDGRRLACNWGIFRPPVDVRQPSTTAEMRCGPACKRFFTGLSGTMRLTALPERCPWLLSISRSRPRGGRRGRPAAPTHTRSGGRCCDAGGLPAGA